ncbi:hypothetical protein O7635_21695 [Asanoa sp. WMMD1127]|uniref:hypothetical protein n=1 Tax=Asanoa sp. WMMD1127 TaxID=3016107 RepID=UPI0024162704|nr:hypothetical protein [Asanoa sp. WMMD1127]MDG4824473.1 hypothetical protein [Asanoa sp. WMMD1127]
MTRREKWRLAIGPLLAWPVTALIWLAVTDDSVVEAVAWTFAILAVTFVLMFWTGSRAREDGDEA